MTWCDYGDVLDITWANQDRETKKSWWQDPCKQFTSKLSHAPLDKATKQPLLDHPGVGSERPKEHHDFHSLLWFLRLAEPSLNCFSCKCEPEGLALCNTACSMPRKEWIWLEVHKSTSKQFAASQPWTWGLHCKPLRHRNNAACLPLDTSNVCVDICISGALRSTCGGRW